MERGGWRSGPSLSSSVPFSRAALRSWAEWRMSCSSATRVKARPPCPTAPEIESMFRVTCTAGELRAREERETALLGCPGEELSSERREERVKIHARRSRRGEPSFSQGLTSKFGATVATPLLFSPARRRRVALRLCSRPPSSPNSPQFTPPSRSTPTPSPLRRRCPQAPSLRPRRRNLSATLRRPSQFRNLRWRWELTTPSECSARRPRRGGRWERGQRQR